MIIKDTEMMESKMFLDYDIIYDIGLVWMFTIIIMSFCLMLGEYLWMGLNLVFQIIISVGLASEVLILDNELTLFSVSILIAVLFGSIEFIKYQRNK